jgi:hypothetical protein
VETYCSTLVLKKGDQDRIRELAGSLRLGYEYTWLGLQEIASRIPISAAWRTWEYNNLCEQDNAVPQMTDG